MRVRYEAKKEECVRGRVTAEQVEYSSQYLSVTRDVVVGRFANASTSRRFDVRGRSAYKTRRAVSAVCLMHVVGCSGDRVLSNTRQSELVDGPQSAGRPAGRPRWRRLSSDRLPLRRRCRDARKRRTIVAAASRFRRRQVGNQRASRDAARRVQYCPFTSRGRHLMRFSLAAAAANY